MELKPVDLSAPTSTENVSIEFTHDNFTALNTEVEFLKKENAKMMAELEELKKKKEITIHKYETNIVETKAGPDEETLTKIRELEGKLLEAEKSLALKTQEHEKEILSRDTTNKELLAQLTELRSKEPTYRGTIEVLTREKDFYSLKFDETKAERDALLFEKDMLSKKFEELNIRFTELQMSHEKVLSQLHQTQLTIASLESENKLLQESLLAKQDENKALLLRIADMEDARIQVENLKQQINAVIAERDQFASAINLKEYEITGLKKELEKYAYDLKAKKDVIGHITQAEEVLASDVTELRQEVQKRDKLIETLVFQQNELKTNELKFNDTVKFLEAEKAHLLEEAEKLRIENQCLKVEQDRIIVERDGLQHIISEKDLQINAVTADFNRIAAENRELLNTIAELERKRDSILIVLGDREAEIRKLKDSIETYQAEIGFFKEKIKVLEAENRRFIELTQAQETEIFNLRNQVQLIPQLQSRIHELEILVSQLQSQLEPFERMKVELDQLHTQVADLISKNNTLTASLQERDAELAKYKTFVSVYEYSKVRLEEVEKELTQFKALYEAGQIRIKELETMIANLQFSLKNQEEMAREVELFRFQNEKLRIDNQLFITRIQELEASLSTLSIKYKRLETIYLSIKGVAEHIGDVHEKLIETVEETEKMEELLKATPEPVVIKTEIIQQTQQEKTAMNQPEYGQRF